MRLVRRSFVRSFTANYAVVRQHVFEKLCGRNDIGKLASMLDGLFAVAIFDVSASTLYLARDPVGIAPLYVGVGVNGVLMVASELKGLTHPALARVEQFPPGFTATVHVDFARNAHVVADLVTPALFASPSVNGLVHKAIAYRKYWSAFGVVNVPDEKALALPSFEAQFEFWARRLHDTLVAAVVKRVDLCDVPFAVLLSGGLDSSIVAATAARHIKHVCVFWPVCLFVLCLPVLLKHKWNRNVAPTPNCCTRSRSAWPTVPTVRRLSSLPSTSTRFMSNGSFPFVF